MKKELLVSIYALAFIVAICFGMKQSMKSDFELNDLALTNIEALAEI